MAKWTHDGGTGACGHGDCGHGVEVDPCAASGCTEIDAMNSQEIGKLGEILAEAFFIDRGYEVVQKNYRCREGEADLVVRDPGTDEIVLVEVKTRRVRTGRDTLYPEEAVDARKQLRYSRIAACYALDHFPVFSMRFDVVAIVLRSDCEASLEHLMNAFSWDGEQ